MQVLRDIQFASQVSACGMRLASVRAKRVLLPLLMVCVSLLCVGTSSAARSADVVFDESEVALISSLGPWPVETPADPGNQWSGLPWAESLGELLFNDTLFSIDNSLSCATCHRIDAGLADGRALAVGKVTHVRNTQGLLDVGLQRWFGWDGGADSLWAAAIRPMLTEVEMGNDLATIAARLREHQPFVAQLKTADPNIQWSDDNELVVFAAKLMGAYMRTLRSASTSFDVFRQALVDGDLETQRAYSQSARRGLKTFIGSANCMVCHSGPRFSNGEFHDTGRSFFTGVGQVDPGRYTGIKRMRDDPFNLLGRYAYPMTTADSTALSQSRKSRTVKLGQVNWGQWRTPTLRNLTVTPPYLHDGSLVTLREVVDSYADIDPDRLHSEGESILKPLALSNEQRNDLVHFLETLTPSAP